MLHHDKENERIIFCTQNKMSFKIIFPIFLACFFFHLKKSILKDFLSLLLRPCGPSCLGKRGSGHKTMYEVIVQVPAFGPRNNYAPSGSPVTCWDWKAKVSSAGKIRSTVWTRVDASGMGGDGKLNSNIATRCLLAFPAMVISAQQAR